MIVLYERVLLLVQTYWPRRKTTVWRLAIAFMLVAFSVRTANEGWRLLFEPGQLGAVDLRLRYGEIQQWFAGEPVYTSSSHAGYPPASYVMLWPLLGWLDELTARLFWGMTAVVALTGFAALAVRESGARTRTEQIFIALFVVSVYPIPITVGNGQLGTHLLPAIAAGVLLLSRQRAASWRGDLIAAVLLIFGLTKPSLTVPFYWLVLMLPGRIRPILLVGAGYAILTFFAASFQPGPILTIMRDMVNLSSSVNSQGGYIDLASWMGIVGLEAWTLPAAIAVLVALGAWVYWNRRVDPWLLIGVSAIVARVWTYHAVYDDSLILLPAIALFRVAAGAGVDDDRGLAAGGLFTLTWLALEAPGGLHEYPFPWNQVYILGQPVLWAMLLLFLIVRARRERNATSPDRPAQVKGRPAAFPIPFEGAQS